MKKILLVDDNALILDGISKCLAWPSLGCELAGMYYDARSAVEHLNKQSVDIIISDIVLPDITGLSMAKEILQTYPHIKVILISAYEDFQYAQEAIRIGVFDYLEKPIDYAMLAKIVQRAVASIDNDSLANVTFQSEFVANKQLENSIFEALRERNAEGIKTGINRLAESYANKRYSRAEIFMNVYSIMGIILDVAHEKGIEMGDIMEKIVKSFKGHSHTVDELYDLLYRVCMCVCECFNESLNYHSRLCNEICDYIEENYSNPELNVNLLSNVFGVSSAYISVIFKKEKNENLIDRIINKRLEVSRELLRTTDLSIKTISTMVGYNNQYYFSASFKKKYGIVPSLWKQNG